MYIAIALGIVALIMYYVYTHKAETFVYKSWDSVNTGVPVAGWKPPYLPQKI
jgi:hypothetical protein